MANQSKILVTEEDIERIAKNGYHILRKYAEAVDKWKKEYGCVPKQKMEYWHDKAMAFLKDPAKEIEFLENTEIIVR